MIPTRWLQRRRAYWARLEEIVNSTGLSDHLHVLSHDELQELGLLYRQTASDLATVREDPTGRQLDEYLNRLLGRAHNLLYATRRSAPRGLIHFYRAVFPQMFRTFLPYTLAAVLVFLAGAVTGLLLSLHDPGFQRFLLGGRMADTIERREMWTHSILAMKPLASSAIMTNNLMVAFTAFAAGITGGVGTIYMMLMNGLLLGVITGACWQAGMSQQLWSFVAPHGVLELPAIFIAGGAGLLLARGLLFPGVLPRQDSIVLAGGRAVRLILGTIPLLVVAGVVEGFVSPAQFWVGFKFVAAALLGFLLILYLATGGARSRVVR